MVAVPALTPKTTADEEPIVATEVFPELHTPPPASDNATMKPTHRALFPVMVDGCGLTVTTDVAVHPDGIVYVINAVPADIPVTTPPVLTVAIEVGVLLHEPPVVASLKVIMCPSHTLPGYRIGDIGLIVKVAVAMQPVGNV